MPNIRLQQELCDRGGVDHDRADSRSFRMTSAADVVALLKSAMRSGNSFSAVSTGIFYWPLGTHLVDPPLPRRSRISSSPVQGNDDGGRRKPRVPCPASRSRDRDLPTPARIFRQHRTGGRLVPHGPSARPPPVGAVQDPHVVVPINRHERDDSDNLGVLTPRSMSL